MKKQTLKVIMLVAFVFITILATMTSCTENSRAKSWGGTAKITLPAGQKLVNVTWKDANLWYMTRPMRADEVAETYAFNEESSFGMLEGTYIIQEVK